MLAACLAAVSQLGFAGTAGSPGVQEGQSSGFMAWDEDDAPQTCWPPLSVLRMLAPASSCQLPEFPPWGSN